MKNPDDIPEKEWSSREGYLLHRAEKLAKEEKKRRRIVMLVCFFRIVGIVAAVLAVFAVAHCAKANTFIYEERLNDRLGALILAGNLAYACPYPEVTVRLVPGTRSMYPHLDEGCYVVEARKPWSDVKVGDVASFIRPGRGHVEERAVLHRIVAEHTTKKGKAFILRGDNNSRNDSGWFRESDYKKTVYAVVRFTHTGPGPSMTTAAWRAKMAKENSK